MVPALEVKLRLVHVSVSEPFAPLFGSTFPVTVWTSPTRKSAGHDDDCTVKGSELHLKLGVARRSESIAAAASPTSAKKSFDSRAVSVAVST